jgi:hypothetical protein
MTKDAGRSGPGRSNPKNGSWRTAGGATGVDDTDLSWVPEQPGIYAIINSKTGHLLVGMSTNSLRRRIRQQVRDLHLGGRQNHLVQNAVAQSGFGAFRLAVLEVIVGPGRSKNHIRQRELWWAMRFGALEESTGYNLEAGGAWSAAARLRRTEANLMRRGHPRYVYLSGTRLSDKVNPEFLRSWMAGSRWP